MTVRSARLLLAAPVLTLLVLAPAFAGAASHPVACVPMNTTFGAAELVCSIPSEARPQRLRFQLPFAGVHDDTSAGMAARLDGRPLACTADSRPQLRGEDLGDTLSCVITVDAASAPRELRLQLVWFHAEPGDYSLRAE